MQNKILASVFVLFLCCFSLSFVCVASMPNTTYAGLNDGDSDEEDTTWQETEEEEEEENDCDYDEQSDCGDARSEEITQKDVEDFFKLLDDLSDKEEEDNNLPTSKEEIRNENGYLVVSTDIETSGDVDNS